MKKITIAAAAMLIATISFGQTEEKKELSKKMPPMKMLPKDGEVKNIYELPEAMEYEIYNAAGEKIASGNAEFVDITAYKKGHYFIRYGDKTAKFEKK